MNMTADKKLKDLMNWAKSELAQEKNHKLSKYQSAFRDDKIKFLNRLIEVEELFKADRDTHARQEAVEFCLEQYHEDDMVSREEVERWYDTFTQSKGKETVAATKICECKKWHGFDLDGKCFECQGEMYKGKEEAE